MLTQRCSKAELSQCIADMLNATAQCAPSILISKPKFHFLVHIPAFIRRFGPAILFSTERYESFNHVFRLCSIYSNRQAPSRDTCRQFASHDIVKHVATGGYWFDAGARKWVRAGNAVQLCVSEHPSQARLLGLPKSNNHIVPGESPSRKPVPISSGIFRASNPARKAPVSK
jgi:hypothetical protein